MKKPILLAAISCLMAGTAFAGTLDDVIAGLAAEGYVVKEVDKTFLGNYKIEAYKGSIEREVVYNPTLDQVLRDRTDDDGDHSSSVSHSNDDSLDDAENESGDDNDSDGEDGDSGDSDSEGESDSDSEGEGESEGESEGEGEGEGDRGGDD